MCIISERASLWYTGQNKIVLSNYNNKAIISYNNINF